MAHRDSVSTTSCFILLQKSYSFLPQPENLIEAMSSFLSVSSKFEDMVTSFHDHLGTNETFSSDDPRWESVLQCLNLTSHIIKASTDRSETPLDDLEESLRQACATIESETLEVDSDMDGEESVQSCMVHKRLIVTTMLMLHSKWCINSGRAASAVKYLSWCRTQCREFARYLRSASCHSDSLSLDDIAIQVDGVLTMCYEQLATAFYLLGIRRKAEDYALLAVLKQKILHTENFNRIIMQELIHLIQRHTGEEPILYPTRSLMKVKAISTSVDKISTQEISIECVENCNLDMDESTLRLNHSLCKSKNVLACELLHSVMLLSFQLSV